MTESATKPRQGFLASLVSGPAFGKLAEEAGKYAAARAGRLTDRLQNGLSGNGSGDDGGGGGGGSKMGGIVEGVKNLAEGDSPSKAMVKSAASSLKEKVKKAFGGGGGKSGQLKMTNIEEGIDIGLPVDVVYNQWTQLKDFPKFMKGVEGVEQANEIESDWHVKVAFSRRSWKARMTEAIPDRRIVWTSEGAKGHTKGTVTFHPLSDDLTRVLLSMEYYPAGLFEKTGNIWRAGGRRARLDLKHFRRFIALSGEPTGAWRGEIRDGEVVRQPDEGEDRGRQGERDSGDHDDEPGGRDAEDRGRADDADEADDDEEEYDEADEEDEPEPSASRR